MGDSSKEYYSNLLRKGNFEKISKSIEDDFNPEDIELLLIKTESYREQSKYDLAEKLIDIIIKQLDPIHQQTYIIHAKVELLYIYYRESKFTKVKSLIQEIDNDLPNIKDDNYGHEIKSLFNYLKGNIFWKNGKLKEAKSSYKASYDHAIKGDYTRGIIQTKNAQGNIAKLMNKYSKAIDHYNKCLETSREYEDFKYITYSLVNLGDIYRILGNPTKALSYLNKVYMNENKLENVETKAVLLNNLAIVHYLLGDFETTNKYLSKSYNFLRDLDKPRYYSECLFYFTMVSWILNDKNQANAKFEELNTYSKESDNPYVQFRVKLLRALKLAKQDDFISKGTAVQLLEELSNAEINDELYTPISIFRLCDLYLDQYKINMNPEVLDNIQSLISKLENMYQDRESYLLKIEKLRVRGKIDMLKGNFINAQQNLLEGRDLAQTRNLDLISDQIQDEISTLNNEINHFVKNFHRVSSDSPSSSDSSDSSDINISRKIKNLDINITQYKDDLYDFQIFLHPIRMGILRAMVEYNELPVSKIREELDVPWGTLESHIKILNKDNIVHIEKKLRSNSLVKVLLLTNKGRKQYNRFLNFINEHNNILANS